MKPKKTPEKVTQTPQNNTQTPVTSRNSSISLENLKSPIFNIHVHVTPSSSNEFSQVQPVIHLHFGDLVNGLPSGAISQKIETADETSEAKSQLEVHCNSKTEVKSHENSDENTDQKNVVCKKSYSKRNSGICENKNSESPEHVLNKITEKRKSRRDTFSKSQPPLRRSIRLAKNRELLKILKEQSVNEENTAEVSKRKYCKNKIINKTGSLEDATCLKEPILLLHDICKSGVKENTPEKQNLSENCGTSDEKESCSGFTKKNTCKTDCSDKSEKHGSPRESHRKYDSTDNEESNQHGTVNEEDKEDEYDQTDIEEGTHNSTSNSSNSNNSSLVSVSKKCEEFHSVVNSSDNEARNKCKSITDSLEKNNVYDILKLRPQEIVDKTLNGVDGSENNQNNTTVVVQSVEHTVTTLIGSTPNNVFSSDEDEALTLKCVDVNFEETETSKSVSSDNESTVNDSNSDLVFCHKNFKKDDHQSPSMRALSVEKINGYSESINNCNNTTNKNNNNNNNSDNYDDDDDDDDDDVDNIIEEYILLKESEDYKETNVNTPSFQLELIKKEMKKRKVFTKNQGKEKKSFKRKNAAQNSEEASEDSSVTKKMKLSNKTAKKKLLTKRVRKMSSAKDYIPLNVSGPTEFAAAEISKINPYGTHKAKNFKKERIFDKNFNRYSNSKEHQTYMLKVQAAKMRSK